MSEIAYNSLKRELGRGYDVSFLPAGVRIRAKATSGMEGVTPYLLGAHLDTSEDAPNSGAEVIVHENYQGDDIVLAEGVVISPRQFPNLKNYIGDTIYTSNGRTLLGSDDRSGIASIMTFLRYLKESGVPHGEIDVLLTYDEETGLEGASLLDPNRDTKAQFAFTVDGEHGELGTNTFNAASGYLEVPKIDGYFSGKRVTIKIAGVNTFPGHGKREGMKDAYRTLPAVIDGLKDFNPETGVDVAFSIVAVRGSCGGIELEVLHEEARKPYV